MSDALVIAARTLQSELASPFCSRSGARGRGGGGEREADHHVSEALRGAAVGVRQGVHGHRGSGRRAQRQGGSHHALPADAQGCAAHP